MDGAAAGGAGAVGGDLIVEGGVAGAGDGERPVIQEVWEAACQGAEVVMATEKAPPATGTERVGGPRTMGTEVPPRERRG